MENLTYQAFGMTDIGNVRKNNQDSIFFDDLSKIYIVADGMGGHAGGEIASQLCVHTIKEQIKGKIFEKLQSSEQAAQEEMRVLLSSVVNKASERIFERALEDPSLRGMGTTATAFFIHKDTGYVGHVGDSRLYLIRGRYIYQITQDHSLVNEQLRAGVISEAEAETHQLRNVITRSVGYQEEEEVDTDGMQILPGDYFVLSSDGLHGKVSNREISLIVAEQGIKAPSALIDLAKQRGGEDNISVVIICAKEKDSSGRS